MYEDRLCSMSDILVYVWKYSYLLQDSNLTGLGKWYSNKGIDLIYSTTKKRKADEGVTISVR